jgi:hypothetical protein
VITVVLALNLGVKNAMHHPAPAVGHNPQYPTLPVPNVPLPVGSGCTARNKQESGAADAR